MQHAACTFDFFHDQPKHRFYDIRQSAVIELMNELSCFLFNLFLLDELRKFCLCWTLPSKNFRDVSHTGCILCGTSSRSFQYIHYIFMNVLCVCIFLCYTHHIHHMHYCASTCILCLQIVICTHTFQSHGQYFTVGFGEPFITTVNNR